MKGKVTYKMLLEKQDSQFRALTEALKDSLNNVRSALDNSVSKLSKSIDEKIDKLNSNFSSGQPEHLNRKRQETYILASDLNGKRTVGPGKLPGISNKKRIISQDDDSLSLFAPSDVEDDLQQDKGDPLKKVMFVINDTET